MNWEGIQASELNIGFRYFKMEDYSIPYSYSPVLVCNQDNLDVIQYANLFIQASRKGFIYSFENKKESLQILKKYIPDYEKKINLEKCYDLSITSMNFGKKFILLLKIVYFGGAIFGAFLLIYQIIFKTSL